MIIFPMKCPTDVMLGNLCRDYESTIRNNKLISNKLPVYMRPMKYTFLKSFPKTTTGKIKKKSLGKIESEALC